MQRLSGSLGHFQRKEMLHSVLLYKAMIFKIINCLFQYEEKMTLFNSCSPLIFSLKEGYHPLKGKKCQNNEEYAEQTMGAFCWQGANW